MNLPTGSAFEEPIGAGPRVPLPSGCCFIASHCCEGRFCYAYVLYVGSGASCFLNAPSIASCFSFLVSASTFPVSGDSGMEKLEEFHLSASIAAVEKGGRGS